MEEVKITQPRKPRPRLTEDRKFLILSLKREGKTQHYIRHYTGHSLGTIVKVLKEAKMSKSKKVPKKAPKKEKPIVKPETPLVEQTAPVKTNFLQKIAISFCRSLGVTGRMYGND